MERFVFTVTCITDTNIFFNIIRNILAFVYLPILHLCTYLSSKQQFGTTTAVEIKEGESYLWVFLNTFITFHNTMAGILDGTDDYLRSSFRQECERHIENIDDVKPSEEAMAYSYIKANIDLGRTCSSV